MLGKMVRFTSEQQQKESCVHFCQVIMDPPTPAESQDRRTGVVCSLFAQKISTETQVQPFNQQVKKLCFIVGGRGKTLCFSDVIGFYCSVALCSNSSVARILDI